MNRSARRSGLHAALALAMLSLPASAPAFCGFYVAKAEADLFNEASRVVIARDGARTVLTMANDYKGELSEFAIVVPIPTKLERGQINVGNPALIDRIDAFTAPRLVEYFDDDPCERRLRMLESAAPTAMMADAGSRARKAKSLGVTIEAEYTVGEYDIVLLSAKQSDGLATFLDQEGYRLPKGAARVLGSYIKQGMRFFLAKVNLEEQGKLGHSYLRPLQIAYEHDRFMLPIRLGTLNAEGSQELFVYALTPNGRVETTNYRTQKIPSGMDIPVYVKEEFGEFYKSMFEEQVRKDGMKAVYLEYAWNMGWCDPCAADPLTREELRGLGVFWIDAPSGRGGTGLSGDGQPVIPRQIRPRPISPQPVRNVFVTRLHVRYTAQNFPDDLMFQETGDTSNFQGRYVLRHPWKGTSQCEQADVYREELQKRQQKQAETLASLTGWDIAKIRERIGVVETAGDGGSTKWWQHLWPSTE